ncbi:MAG: hypothetical protein IPP15_05060 [Saprospiraceae bacterium]|uniref:Uncharacterized protein n=1 Tax=Candidatus Opimibacter skivensis TaxID=2982028 RepID=A0A9D7SRK9_9BACT|nr:hypothetical protein [Candidatus Opimibacter skivensis]
MNKSIGIVLIILSLFLGYVGINKLDNSGGEVNILGIKISAQDKGAKETAFIIIGAGVLCLIGGVSILNKKSA